MSRTLLARRRWEGKLTHVDRHTHAHNTGAPMRADIHAQADTNAPDRTHAHVDTRWHEANPV